MMSCDSCKECPPAQEEVRWFALIKIDGPEIILGQVKKSELCNAVRSKGLFEIKEPMRMEFVQQGNQVGQSISPFYPVMTKQNSVMQNGAQVNAVEWLGEIEVDESSGDAVCYGESHLFNLCQEVRTKYRAHLSGIVMPGSGNVDMEVQNNTINFPNPKHRK